MVLKLLEHTRSNADERSPDIQGPERLTNAHSRIGDAEHGHAHGHMHDVDGKKVPESQPLTLSDEKAASDVDSTYSRHQSAAQIVGVAILEFGESAIASIQVGRLSKVLDS